MINTLKRYLRVVLGYLVELFCSKPCLGDDIYILLREAVEQLVLVTEGYHVSYLVEEVIGIYGVGSKRLAVIIQLSATAGQMESLVRMGKNSFAHLVHGFIVYDHHDPDRDLKMIFSVYKFLPYTFSLPSAYNSDFSK